MLFGASKSDSTSASSILRPLYWTMTRSAVSATTPILWVIMISAHAVLGLQADQQIEDLLLDGDVERGGRLVGDQQLGIAGDGHGDHDALALAARHLVREGPQPLGRVGNADLRQQLDGAGAARGAVHAHVEAQHLLDLEADGEAGIEAGHRLLEDHRDVLADDLAPLGAASASSRSLPSNVIRSAVTLAVHGSRPITASIATDLPEPDSPTIASTSRAIDAAGRYAVDGRERADGGVELDGEVFDLEQRPCSAPLQLGVERVAQAVADEVDGEHGDRGWQGPGRSPPTRRAG